MMRPTSSSDSPGGLGRISMLLAWHGLALLAVTLGSQAFAFRAISRGDLTAVGYALLVAVAYLGLALALAVTDRRSRPLNLLGGIVGVIVSYGALWAILERRVDLRVPGLPALLAAYGGIPLAFIPYLVGRYVPVAAGVLALALVGGVAATMGQRTAPGARSDRSTVSTELKQLTLTTYRNLAGPLEPRGGAIEAHRDSLLVINDLGELFRLTRNADGALGSARLTPVVPMNRDRYVADLRSLPTAPKLRVSDMTIGRFKDEETLFVAHQYWNAADECFTVRVSHTPMAEIDDGASAQQKGWTTLYESAPCVAPTGTFNDDGNGGRLGWFENKLLLTIGDHGFDGRLGGRMLAQADDNPYGKVHLLDLAGGVEVISKGHRNPQGLFVDPEQRIWVTEHGPSGGDELNLLERGRNYGWPLATYGTEYGRHVWPPAAGTSDHGDFAEPFYAFVPSPGISPIIGITSERFPEWRGDLLIGSLRTQSLWRTRVRQGRVMYVERIEIGGRVWDIVWTNAGTVIEIAPSDPKDVGDAVYARCEACHEAPPGETPSAPSLHFILRKDVASQTGYDYSPALRAVGGRWTEARMDEFLRDPNAFAPGTQMTQGKVEDPAERRAIVEFLKNYR
jgi:cytochrome c2